MTATLHATTRAELTAGEAISWWPSTPSDRSTGRDPAVGFALSAGAATWWRLERGVPTTSSGKEVPFDGVYELVGFDGDRELRWRNDNGGRGRAVVLADAPEALPTCGDAGSPATRLDGVQERILAGQVRPQGSHGWFRLTAARYAPADVPVDLPDGFGLDGRGHDTPVVVLESVEYAVEDRHGNLSVVDRRHTRLRLRRRRDLHLDLSKEA